MECILHLPESGLVGLVVHLQGPSHVVEFQGIFTMIVYTDQQYSTQIITSVYQYQVVHILLYKHV